MSYRSTNFLLAAFAFVLSCTAQHVEAGFTFLGPTPYRSTADSPFAEYLDQPNFYLEDFEDGELNTPGISQPTQPFPIFDSWHGVVVPPGEFTDSVDADDGAVDGDGTGGHSFRTNQHLVSPMIPARNQLSFRFSFDGDLPGGLPEWFGFVWTDGPKGIEFGNGLEIELLASDALGDRSSGGKYRLPGDGLRNGGTSEDVFFGVHSLSGIKELVILAVFFGESGGFEHFEIDHIQYGSLVVPEPQALAQIVTFFFLFGSQRFRSSS